MTILDKIIEHKRKEVAKRKELYPVALLEQSIYYDTPVVSMKKYLTRPDKLGIIAEFKRKSPSKGAINLYAKVEQVSIGYMQAGASALSVLTDQEFFGGKNGDLTEARKFNFCPILRKDFVVDEYQIAEARSIGADTILLIAACLGTEEVVRLSAYAQSLGLEVLMEVHEKEELQKLCDTVDIVGVNNRNLKDFSVSIETSLALADDIPNDFIKITESGISNAEAIVELKQAGFQGFLIGEYFMQSSLPQQVCMNLVEEVRQLEGKLVKKT